ncbi:hypothetical protein G4Y79_13665 [Phototrophicus methaneseepsis]|uniref:Uncharacterized protein n=1 Tax=Phototrophicus methaneseepsis TaxID=2710758 RepID=A0A7S8ICP6_9CHLR|nr:hypothetical protein [Phototrophicus methaneseepsis]QPC80757.1 hypothetical protein G4Y79_13665 [Phototrophicus methaneseepsis]
MPEPTPAKSNNTSSTSPYTSDIRRFFSRDYTVSKRQLGIVLLVIGVLGFIGILGIDILDVGREGGIGPAQQGALALCAAMAVIGLTLIPLGNKPA